MGTAKRGGRGLANLAYMIIFGEGFEKREGQIGGGMERRIDGELIGLANLFSIFD